MMQDVLFSSVHLEESRKLYHQLSNKKLLLLHGVKFSSFGCIEILFEVKDSVINMFFPFNIFVRE